MNNQTRTELVNIIIDVLNERGEGINTSELHNECFNTDYFIIGRYEAEEWLKENYGIFSAIEKIKEYEQDNFGEVTTDLSESERVCNMLVYILGEEIINELDFISNNWDEVLTSEMIVELIEELENL